LLLLHAESLRKPAMLNLLFSPCPQYLRFADSPKSPIRLVPSSRFASDSPRSPIRLISSSRFASDSPRSPIRLVSSSRFASDSPKSTIRLVLPLRLATIQVPSDAPKRTTPRLWGSFLLLLHAESLRKPEMRNSAKPFLPMHIFAQGDFLQNSAGFADCCDDILHICSCFVNHISMR